MKLHAHYFVIILSCMMGVLFPSISLGEEYLGNKFKLRSISPYFRMQLPFTAPSIIDSNFFHRQYRLWFNFAAGVDLFERFALEGGILFSPIWFVDEHDHGPKGYFGASRYYFSKGRFRPFALVGFANYSSDVIDKSYDPENVKGPAVYYGVGLKWRITKRFSLTSQAFVNHHWEKFNGNPAANPTRSTTLRTFPTFEIAGLEWNF